jgi:hypothetical protein
LHHSIAGPFSNGLNNAIAGSFADKPFSGSFQSSRAGSPLDSRRDPLAQPLRALHQADVRCPLL